MGNIPVLKPREVVKILKTLALLKFVREGLTNNLVIRMAELPLFRFTRAGIYLRHCYAKLLMMYT